MTRLLAVIVPLLAAGTLAFPTGSDAQSPGLLQGVKADRSPSPIGEPVTFTYAVRNRGSQPVTYTFSSSKQFDVWVKRGETEIFRLSKGKVYATVITNMTLGPGETKTFTAQWNQKDDKGTQVGPGVYTIHAQLTPRGEAPAPTSNKIEIGTVSAALVPVTVRETVSRSVLLTGKRVAIEAAYRGNQPDPKDPNVKNGPPVGRGDWIVCDSTGCIYVSGPDKLNPARDSGTPVTVTGKVQRTTKGQVYLALESVAVRRPTARR